MGHQMAINVADPLDHTLHKQALMMEQMMQLQNSTSDVRIVTECDRSFDRLGRMCALMLENFLACENGCGAWIHTASVSQHV